jgi:hypothetical protein
MTTFQRYDDDERTTYDGVHAVPDHVEEQSGRVSERLDVIFSGHGRRHRV